MNAAFSRFWLAVSALLTMVASGCRSSLPPSVTFPNSAVSPASSSFVRLVDVAQQAGLNYRWTPPGKRPFTILGTIGNGCAFLDFNADGNLDILLVGSPCALYQGDGKGKFTDVGAETGIANLRGHFLGCAVGDYDNDGFSDIYLTAYRGGALLHNERGKQFRVMNAGIPAQLWATSASFCDIDRDDWLELYIANYADFDSKTQPQLCDFGGIQSACGPRFYKPLKGKLYRNIGGKRFEDITQKSGASEVQGRGLGVAAADFDGSGRDSIAIANDEIPGDLLRNQGGGKFVNEGETAGTARNHEGAPYGGMGIDWGDYDNDGKLDLIVGTFQNEVKTLYQNNGDGTFTNRSGEMGMDSVALPYVTFGVKFLDLENDGRLDLILANGHVQDNMEQIDKALTYRQPLVLLGNDGTRFMDLSPTVLGKLPAIVGRGLATGDYDNDGKVDVLIVDSEGSPLLLHNETPNAGNWLEVALEGKSKSNRNAFGAIATAILPDGRKLVRRCQSDGSYLSASDPRLHFGLGSAQAVTMEIRWTDGKTTQHPNLPTNQIVKLRQP